MTFEKEYPSLKDKIQHIAGMGWNYITIKDVRENCLDKQRVREFIPLLIQEYGFDDQVDNAIKLAEKVLGL